MYPPFCTQEIKKARRRSTAAAAIDYCYIALGCGGSGCDTSTW